jgi:CDP-diacylglycerol--glycerol-3-phosphate 3-phosphatidyltransferase
MKENSDSANTHAPPITMATKITILRILGIPVFVLLLIYYKGAISAGLPGDAYRIAALATFIIIAATDALDGYLARSRNEITRLGTILDPIADKGLMLASLITLTRPSLTALTPQFPVWFTLLAISRDTILILGSFLINALHAHVEIKPRPIGKGSTVLLMLSIIMLLSKCQQKTLNILLFVTATCIFVSGIQYLIDGIRQLENGHANKKES